jgi:uncharacterized protein (DUF4415 family)
MTEKKRATHTDLKKLDAHVIRHEEYEDIPELSEEWFAKATFQINGVPVPRGRPRSANPKQHVNLRLDPDVLEYFQAGGVGWQTRINAALRKVARLDRPAQTSVAKTSAAKTSAAKRPTAKASAAKRPAAKRSAAKRSAKRPSR